ALAAGQSHSYTINLEQDQFLQLVVDQRGIDVVVRVFSPAGRRLSEVDTPNGTNGPEDVTVIAEAAGVYRIEVTPLDPTPPPGRYEINFVASFSSEPHKRLAALIWKPARVCERCNCGRI